MALISIRKHARAAHVTLRLEYDSAVLRLTIQDDGAGFAPEQVTQTATSGFGLTGMSERAHLLGATLEIHSSPGCGTRITAAVGIP